MNAKATMWIDGPLSQLPLNDAVEGLLSSGIVKRISGEWVLLAWPASYSGMYHLHGENVVGCLRGSRICMECGEEWPKDLEGFINLRQSGMR